MSIYKKIYEAKKGIGTILKDSKNPFFKSNYLSLNGLIDAIETVLVENELILLQPIKDGFVVTQLIDTENGEIVESSIQLPNITDPQKLGSCITYYRRYTLQSLLGLQAEDDDGNAATKTVIEERKPSLTDDQFKKCLLADKAQINTVLNKYRMTTKQRDELIKFTK